MFDGGICFFGWVFVLVVGCGNVGSGVFVFKVDLVLLFVVGVFYYYY